MKRFYTTSSGKTFRRCPREYYISVELGMSSVDMAKALLWGRCWDAAMAYLWTRDTAWELGAALQYAQEEQSWQQLDDVDHINLEVLLAGYIARWSSDLESTERLGAKLQFRAPLVNPETGGRSTTMDLAGELDGIATIEDRVTIIEHKSSGQDISPGSTYWEKLKLDSQCSNYYVGARSLGFEPVAVLYDVVKKPTIKRLLATPEADRKYTRATKTEPSRLYANQRAEDETLEEYRARLSEDVASRPDFYFARCEVVRTEQEQTDAAFDVWEACQSINACSRRERWSRNTDACERYGRMCQFWPVCTGQTTLDNQEKYQFIGAHPELGNV